MRSARVTSSKLRPAAPLPRALLRPAPHCPKPCCALLHTAPSPDLTTAGLKEPPRSVARTSRTLVAARIVRSQGSHSQTSALGRADDGYIVKGTRYTATANRVLNKTCAEIATRGGARFSCSEPAKASALTAALSDASGRCCNVVTFGKKGARRPSPPKPQPPQPRPPRRGAPHSNAEGGRSMQHAMRCAPVTRALLYQATVSRFAPSSAARSALSRRGPRRALHLGLAGSPSLAVGPSSSKLEVPPWSPCLGGATARCPRLLRRAGFALGGAPRTGEAAAPLRAE